MSPVKACKQALRRSFWGTVANVLRRGGRKAPTTRIHACRYHEHLFHLWRGLCWLERVVGRRVGKKALGFKAISDKDQAGTKIRSQHQRDTELLRQSEPQTLIKVRADPEFVGRLSRQWHPR